VISPNSIRRRGLAAIAAAAVLSALAVATSAPAGAAEESVEPLELLRESTVSAFDVSSRAARGDRSSPSSKLRSDVPVFTLSKGRFTAFDPPGQGAPEGVATNNRGEIVGGYARDLNRDCRLFRGFLRDGRGRFTVSRFNIPGARRTLPVDLNDRRQIVGNYQDSCADPLRGFLRARSGRITRIDFPDAMQTQAVGINNSGQVVGQYDDADGTFHGYLWEAGRFTTIDGPEGAAGASVTDINNRGEMVGVYLDAAGAIHGFFLSGGVYTTFDAPDAQFIAPFGLNNRGQIAGYTGDIGDTALINVRGFVLRRGADGPLTPIDFPGAVETVATDINDAGTIVGVYPRIPLSVKPNRKTVNQGEGATFTAIVPNDRGVVLNGAKVCVRAPTAIRVKGCVNLGTVDGDVKVRFKANARRSAKQKAYKLRFAASATGVDPVTATATLKVKAKR
jgi:probable HAF family extracellular repeat protein